MNVGEETANECGSQTPGLGTNNAVIAIIGMSLLEKFTAGRVVRCMDSGRRRHET